MPLDQPPAPAPQVEQVVITAARLPPAPGDAAFSIIRIAPEVLRDAPRLDEALKQVPGVSLFRRTSSSAANPTTQGLSLRSIGPSGAGRALVTLDGVPQNDPFGGWVIWTSLPREAIEGATVVRGAGAGPYGAGALTGVVSLDELSRPGAISAAVEGGGLGTRRAAAAVDIPAGSGQLFLDASSEHSDGWIPVRKGRGAADDALRLDDWSAAARLQEQVGPALVAARVSAYREDRDAGLVGAASTEKGQIASLTATVQPSPGGFGWRLQGWVHHSNLANASVSVAPGRVSTTPTNDQYSTPATGWGLNAALRRQGEHVVWEAGADVRGAEGEDNELFRNLGAGFTRNRVAGGRTLTGGVYMEAADANGPWLVTGGARLDGWATQNGHRVETDTATGLVTFQQTSPDRSGLLPTARLGLKRSFEDGLFIRAAAYAGFRPPTLNELYRPFRVGNDITEANPDLKPERLFGVEAAIGGVYGRTAWDATLFRNRLQGAVTNVTVGVGPGVIPGFPGAGFIPPGGTLRQRQNAGIINATGLEAEVQQGVGDRLSLRAAVDFTDATVDGGASAPQLTGLRPAQAPRVTATASTDWRPLERLRLFADLRYESARFDDDLNTRRLAPSARVDARVEWAISREASVYVAADNLFDSAIATGVAGDGSISYDAPRVARIGITWRR